MCMCILDLPELDCKRSERENLAERYGVVVHPTPSIATVVVGAVDRV